MRHHRTTPITPPKQASRFGSREPAVRTALAATSLAVAIGSVVFIGPGHLLFDGIAVIAGVVFADDLFHWAHRWRKGRSR
jgi:hypothetical protein